jgi:hypothetical protein
MRILLLAGAAALTLTALPTALGAQESVGGAAEQPVDGAADRAPAAAETAVTPPTEPASRTTSVTPNPGAPATVTYRPNGTTTVSPNPGGPAVVTHNNPGNLTSPPQSAMNKRYPVCTRRLQDNCQNPGEGGAPGKSRALGYWPGESASERRERGG